MAETSVRVWLDPDGEPYDWGFTCARCPSPGSVYVSDEVGHDPSDEHVKATMRDHLLRVHAEIPNERD